MINRFQIIKYTPRIVVAFILLQTLWFKFGIGGAEALEESKMIFVTLSNALFGNNHHEAFLRIGTGIVELAISILIFTRWSYYGALMGIGVMIGALLSHLLFLGISINQDSGQLMAMSIITLIGCIKIAYDEKFSKV
ncbi:DoxX family protein [Reichenbachiella agarivorans]|uniref:DoxX family protein n=1 Tax=Reichenbachiella agarivorans TaxID=2979464 RepID=A0ABY6CMH1_9BACT|nr:DoxX family protein [Reichenbachiella agarivorans]UXP31713.1 DoxX family protein [Reichenbachiella agarivorans]